MTDFNTHQGNGASKSSIGSESVPPQKKGVFRRAIEVTLKVGVAAVIGVVLYRQFSGLDTGAVWNLIERMGWGTALVLIPASLTTLIDTFGWSACVLRASALSLVVPLLPIRIGCDAILNSIPLGLAVGETVRPWLLHRQCGVALPDAIASCLLAKVNMAMAQILFVLSVAVLFLGGGQSALLERSAGGAGTLVIGGIILIPLLAGLMLVYTGPRLSQFSNLLNRVRWAPLQRFLEGIAPNLQSIDSYVRDFGSLNRSRLVQSLLAFFAGWIFIGLESFVILSLLGARVAVWQALSLEAVASLLRITFFFLPSALGAAEIAYAALIASFGIPDAITMAAAFIAVKRSREVLWILLGYSTFLLPRTRSAAKMAFDSKPAER
jgi:hypothetical protein